MITVSFNNTYMNMTGGNTQPDGNDRSERENPMQKDKRISEGQTKPATQRDRRTTLGRAPLFRK
jgi:hypothetical protein